MPTTSEISDIVDWGSGHWKQCLQKLCHATALPIVLYDAVIYILCCLIQSSPSNARDFSGLTVKCQNHLFEGRGVGKTV